MHNLKMFSYENLLVWIIGFVIISLMVERALFQVYHMKAWKTLEAKLDDLLGGDYLDLKPLISKAVCIYIAFSLKLDLPAFLFKINKPDIARIVLTGLMLSGGSTALVWVFKRARVVKDVAYSVNVKKLKEINGD